MNSSQTDLGKSVIFQPVLQAYPTRHSWIITTLISLGNLECHWKLFTRQLSRTQFLRSLDQHPSTPMQLLSTLQLELSNIQDIYKSSESTITSAIQLPNSNQLQTHTWCRRSLLPFLGDAFSWLTGTATTKDIHSIKTWINQLIGMQISQHNTLVHIVSILNITRYATQVNRHSINNLIDAVHTTSQDINNLYNLTTSLATSINFNQMILHIRSLFANLQDSLHYLWMVSTHYGIHQCCHIWNTVTTCLTHHWFTKDAMIHSWHPTSNPAPTNFTRGHSTFLQVPAYSCLDWEQTVFIIDWHTHTR